MFEAASQAGIFLSKFQRSTYNVNHLKGQPYWTPDELGLTVKEKVLQKYPWSKFGSSENSSLLVDFIIELY